MRYIYTIKAPLAQLVEHLTLNQMVTGSIPVWCTKFIKNFFRGRRTASFYFLAKHIDNIRITSYIEKYIVIIIDIYDKI